MRVQHALLPLLFTLSFAETFNARHGLRIRQEGNDVATATSDAPLTTTAADDRSSTVTESASVTSSSEDVPTFTESNPGDVTSPITTPGGASSTPTMTESPIPTATNGTTNDNDLPIEPEITPALGVGGVLLIFAGIGLGFVGIKHRATQTFLSTALLVALGCEVLIIYLMNPPVSDAAQGAFLVAGVLGGCLLGGLALISQEVSEGFGCILGGFCFAMWLLVLVPGGIIKNQVGRSVLLSCFCAACFCLYLSRYTRIYGIIICTSFAGATSFMLGIDCFARAGLKEFWVYIWNLNEDIFPLFTETYPMTKNMRAEIAGIVIIAFFGTMSQIKIWSIVKETKSKRDADRLAYERAREVEEAELGRGIEERNKHDIAQWEGAYDDKKMPQTTVESTTSVNAYGAATTELDITNTNEDRRVSFPLVHLRPATRDEEMSGGLDHISPANGLAITENKRSSTVPSITPLEAGHLKGQTSPSSAQLRSPPSASLGTPKSPARESQASIKSIALHSSPALPHDEQDGKEGDTAAAKHVSSVSLAAIEIPETNEEPDEPFDWDLASSIAATNAEPPDLDTLSMTLSRPVSAFLSQHGGSPMLPYEQFIEEDEEALITLSKHRKSMPRSPSLGARASYSHLTSPSLGSVVKASLTDKLPLRLSRAALSHRTNEWAKEVGRAEPEPIEKVEDHTLDAVRIETCNAADAARAKQNNAAPLPPPPPPIAPQPAPAPVEEPPQSPSTNPYRRSKNLTSSPPNPALTQVQVEDDSSWSIPLGQQRSSNPLSPIPANGMNASVLTQEQAGPIPKRSLSAMSNTPNLLDERREMIGRKITSTSFMVPPISEDAGDAPESSKGDRTSLSEHTKPSTNTSIGDEQDGEDMTLAQRKALVQQQLQLDLLQSPHSMHSPLSMQSPHSMQSPRSMQSISRQGSQMYQPRSLSRHASQPVSQSMVDLTSNQPRSSSRVLRMSGPTGNTHQPQHMSSHDQTRQAMNWSTWRSSAGLDIKQQDPVDTPNSQMDMMRAMRVQSEVEAKQRQQDAQARQAQMDAHMRMGGMNDAHRIAMAKMQGKANAQVQ